MKPAYAAVTALVAVWTVTAVPTAKANTESVPCGVLDQLRDSLDTGVSAGMAGVRTVITSPYVSGVPQKRDAEANLVLVSHGVHTMQDINRAGVVPGLAPLLENLDRATADMSDAVEALFQVTWGGYDFDFGSTYTLAFPQPATWTVIDYADHQKDEVYALVNSLQPACTR
jgi:hypothetical protein